MILVDDGIATGFTARAGIQHSLDSMRSFADEVVIVDTPPWVFAIGEFYQDFAQTSDEEVVPLLEEGAAVRPAS